MDGLTSKERELAWQAIFTPSFHGTCIISSSGFITSANPEFSEILGVTPAEILGKTFMEITVPGQIKEIDIQNAELVKKGVNKSYILDKKYRFGDKEPVAVTLLVVGVYGEMEEFLFYVARIMQQLTPACDPLLLPPLVYGSDVSSQKQTLSSKAFEYVYNNRNQILFVSGVLGSLFMMLWQALIQGKLKF